MSKWDELNDPVHPHLIAKGLTAPAVPAGLVFGPNSTTAKSNVLAATRILQGDKSLALGYMNILLAILEVADVMITFGDEQGQGVAKVLVYIPSMHKNMSIDVAGFVYYYVRLKTYIQTQRPQWLAGTNFTLPAYVGPKITAQGNDANGVAFSMPAKYAQGQTLFPPAQHFTMCNDEPSRYLSHHAEMSIYKGLCRIFNLDMAGFFNNNDVAERDRVEIGQLMLTCRDGDLSIVRMAIAQHFQQQQNAYVANDDIPAEDRAEIDELLQPERDMVEAGGDEAEQS